VAMSFFGRRMSTEFGKAGAATAATHNQAHQNSDACVCRAQRNLRRGSGVQGVGMMIDPPSYILSWRPGTRVDVFAMRARLPSRHFWTIPDYRSLANYSKKADIGVRLWLADPEDRARTIGERIPLLRRGQCGIAGNRAQPKSPNSCIDTNADFEYGRCVIVDSGLGIPVTGENHVQPSPSTSTDSGSMGICP